MRKPAIPTGVQDPQGAPEPVLDGELHGGGATLAVSIACATRITLLVAFHGPPPPDRTVFDRLAVRSAEGSIDLSRCRFDAGAHAPGFAGRLLFLDDVYDVRTLLFDRELVSVRSALDGLPMMLAKREGIRPEFRDVVADVTYDLSVLRKCYDEQERLLAHEPPEVAEAARDAIVRAERTRFFGVMDRHLAALGAVVKGYTRDEHERHGFYLRRQVWPFISASCILKRTNEKPFGYAGDAEMMRLIYANAYMGASVFERLMHKHPMEQPGADAVRSRRRLIARAIRRLLDAPHAAREPFRFLSVAAGPACELEDVFEGVGAQERGARLRCALLDQDPHAIAAARETVSAIEDAYGLPLRVAYYQDSVRTMLGSNVVERFGPQEFVYSMGLFDYLSTPVARAVLARMYALLSPGGLLIVGNYHVGHPSRVYMDYWMDWPLYYRTEESFLALTAGLPDVEARIDFDATGCQMFLHLERRRDAA